ncbi:MAG: hypothetical protein RL235_394 [Chlamydiota bacterium]|jgi:hypothetical protein
MKDIPHHLKKLNRRVIRSARREGAQEESAYLYVMPERPARQLRQQVRARIRAERTRRVPGVLSAEEKQKRMSNRVPVFDRLNSGRIKGTRSTHKKTPRI